MARQAPDNRPCITHNTPLFGLIPIYWLKSRVFDTCVNAKCTDILQLHTKLRKDGRHNYRGLQVPVQSKLNPEAWKKYLQEYWDWQFLYSLNSDIRWILTDSVITSQRINHKSVTEYPDHVTAYLKEEIQYQAFLTLLLPTYTPVLL